MAKLKLDGDVEIEYILTKKSVKNINMHFKPDGIIYISAPYRVSKDYVEQILIKDSATIIKKLENIQKKVDQEEKSLEYLSYLGEKYKIEFVEKGYEYTEIKEDKFLISTRLERTDENIKFLIRRWQLKQCMVLYKKINQEVYSDFISKGYKVPLANIYIKDMTSRWGSCNYVKGKISMNIRLCEYPMECIYSVFYHEYMHFKHHNHSKDFHNDLNSIFPDYEKCHGVLNG